MNRPQYNYKSPPKSRSGKGIGPSAAFIFGLSRGFYLPPRERFRRSRDVKQESGRSSPQGPAPDPAKRPDGLGHALARLLGRQSGDA